MKKILTLWLPLAALILATVDGFKSIPWMFEELGFIENLTVFFLVGAMLILVKHAIGHFREMGLLDRLLLVVLILGSVYFAGEELSWGQHLGEVIFGFQTEQGRWEGNYQNEMNLHNREGWLGFFLDQLPRNLMTVGIGIAGIVFPFVRNKLPNWMGRYVTGRDVVFVSFLAVFVSVPNKLVKLFVDARSKFESGEMKEFYIALFILLFTMNFVDVMRSEIADKPGSES